MTMSNLTPDAIDEVEEGLSPEVARARARLRKIIEEQGTKPITLEQLHAMGDLWPEDESVDDFIAAVREWRRDGDTRRLP